MLSPGEITDMRGTLDESLPDTATITRPASSSDGAGGRSQAFAVVATVACRLSPEKDVGAAEPLTADRVTPRKRWLITLPASTVVRRTDRITVAGRSFEVSAIRARRSWELATVVEAVEVGT